MPVRLFVTSYITRMSAVLEQAPHLKRGIYKHRGERADKHNQQKHLRETGLLLVCLGQVSGLPIKGQERTVSSLIRPIPSATP